MKKLFSLLLLLGSSSVQLAQANILSLFHLQPAAQNQTQPKKASPQVQQQAPNPATFRMQPQASQAQAIPRIPLEETQPLMQPGLQTPYLFQSTAPIQQGIQQQIQPIQPQNQDPSKGIYYYVDYDPSSNVKDIPLKNMKMKVEVYYYGNPEGRIDVTTDDNQTFNIGSEYKDKESLTVEVLSITDQSKYNAKCFGLVTPGYTKVMIKCDPSKKMI